MSCKSKSCILDPLLVLLLKELVDILVNLITKIINKSLNTGIFPDKWMENWISNATTQIIWSEKSFFSNYRLVTNLSFIYKLIKKAALKFLVPQFNRIESFSFYNSAYKTNYSTETLLTKMTSNILCSMDKQQMSFLVLLDLSAAFDSISHSKLFTILKKCIQY